MSNKWHDFPEEKPQKSGEYTVEDRKGRVFQTWYETTIQGFNQVYKGVGYRIIRWRENDETLHDSNT